MDYFFRKTISRVPLCAAHRALSFAYIACVHFINHAFIYIIYIYIYIYIYIFLSLLFFSFKDRTVDYFFRKTISRVPLCAAHRALSFAYIACMHFKLLHICIYIYIYILYISFCLFYFTVSKIELLIIFFRKTISRVPLCAAHRALSFAYAGRSIYIYMCVCVSVMQFICIRYL